MGFLWVFILTSVLKTYLVLDLAPYPVFGSYTHMILQQLGYDGDYAESPVYLDSLSSYKVVFIFSESNNPQNPNLRWHFTTGDISKLKRFLTLPDRGLVWQGYFAWVEEPASPELCYIMGVKPDSFVMWSWWEIFNFEYGSGTPLNISTMPWLIMTLEAKPGINKSEPFIRSRRASEDSYMYCGVYGKTGASRTIALGFVGAALWQGKYPLLLNYMMKYLEGRAKGGTPLHIIYPPPFIK